MRITKNHQDEFTAESSDAAMVPAVKSETAEPSRYYLGKNAKEWFDKYCDLESASKVIDDEVRNAVSLLKTTLETCQCTIAELEGENAELKSQVSALQASQVTQPLPEFVIQHWPRYTNGDPIILGTSEIRGQDGNISTVEAVRITTYDVELFAEDRVYLGRSFWKGVDEPLELPTFESYDDIVSLLKRVSDSVGSKTDAKTYANLVIDTLKTHVLTDEDDQDN